MPLLCFVLDTSASMNQKTVQGQRLIDHAKTAIENFISKVMTQLLWVIIMTSSSYPISNMPHKKKRSSFSLRKEVWSFGVGIKNKYLGWGVIPWVGSDLFSDWSIFSSFFSHLKSVLLSLEVKSFSIESVEVKSPRPRLRENDLAPSCGMLFQFSTLMTHDCIPNDS